ncbi:MAG: hypothetical protein HY851_00250 [candidate division Zixibacteria bacterium]|nr:hypothetical protein [candidate division Zixibacteria bacterium]
MTIETFDRDYDLPSLVIKPLYFGLVANILIPMALLLVCYYLEMHTPPPDRIGIGANTLFIVFAVLAVGQAAFALWYRARQFARPMVTHLDRFEEDVKRGLVSRSRPVFMMVGAISLWGVAYYLLTGRFNEGVMFVVFSFIVFQFIRPRYGSVQKLLDHQLALAKRGELLSS